jgi:hypothetical protein
VTNPYYNHGGYPATRAPGASAAARSEFSQIASGFNKLPNSIVARGYVIGNAAGDGMEMIARTAVLADIGGVDSDFVEGVVQSGETTWLTSISGVNTITGVAAPAITAYAAGLRLSFLSVGRNTGAVTVNAGAGAVSLKVGGHELSPGDIPGIVTVEIIHNGTNFELLSVSQSTYSPNLLINSTFVPGMDELLSHPGATDDVYITDGFYTLLQSGSALTTAAANPFVGVQYGAGVQNPDVTAKRMALCQIIETADTAKVRGLVVSFGLGAYISQSQALRYAVLAWTGGENAVTSDVVNNWTSSNYTAGNFFIGSNLSVLAVGSLTPSAATWTDLPPIFATVPSNASNLIVMVWSEGTMAAASSLMIARPNLTRGLSSWQPGPNPQEVARCRWFYETLGEASANFYLGAGFADGTTTVRGRISYSDKGGGTVGITATGPSGGQFIVNRTGSELTSTSAAFSNIGRTGAMVTLTSLSGAATAMEGCLVGLSSGEKVIVSSRL